jgi:hypothetical protein
MPSVMLHASGVNHKRRGQPFFPPQPAESASPSLGRPKAKQVAFSGKVSDDLAAQFRDAVSRNGTNANALIGQFIADYVPAARQMSDSVRGRGRPRREKR